MTAIDLAHLGDLAGREVGVSDWLVVAQDRIDAFADATGDRQWIHVDRGARQRPARRSARRSRTAS